MTKVVVPVSSLKTWFLGNDVDAHWVHVTSKPEAFNSPRLHEELCVSSFSTPRFFSVSAHTAIIFRATARKWFVADCWSYQRSDGSRTTAENIIAEEGWCPNRNDEAWISAGSQPLVVLTTKPEGLGCEQVGGAPIFAIKDLEVQTVKEALEAFLDGTLQDYSPPVSAEWDLELSLIDFDPDLL